jgi:hypothetical protein
MQRRPSGSKISKTDFEACQRKISLQMKQNVEIQAELLKAVSSYRQSIETFSKASEKLSQVAGKLAVSTMSAFQINKEYHALIDLPISMDSEVKQRNLSLALQQVVKFHTLLAIQQSTVVSTVVNDFEKPIQSNLEKYKEVVSVSCCFILFFDPNK